MLDSKANLSEASASDAVPALRRPFYGRWWVTALLVIGDIVALEACVFASYAIRLVMKPWIPIELSPHQFVGVAIGVLSLPVVFAIMNLYPGYGADGAERLRRRVISTAAIFATLIGWDYLVQSGQWSRGILLLTWFLATLSLPVMTAMLISVFVRLKWWGEPVLVMGPPEMVRVAVENLRAVPRIGLVPVGYVRHNDEDANEVGRLVGLPCLGNVRQVNDLADFVGTIMVVNPASYGTRLSAIVANLAFPHVILVPEFSGMQSLWVIARDLGGTSGLEIKKNLLIPHNRIIKRTLDLAISVPLLLLVLPVLLLLCLAIVLISPASPIYTQVREGEDGRRFRMIKLRSMFPDAEQRLAAHLNANPDAKREWHKHYKLRRDPRILPLIGNFLRKSSLDELPQLWHVVSGEMSLVGPRPFPHYHLESFGAEFRTLRRSVRPGITGMWQVEARSDADLVLQEKLDTFYIRNWSIWLDLHILMRTFIAVARGGGAR